VSSGSFSEASEFREFQLSNWFQGVSAKKLGSRSFSGATGFREFQLSK